MRIERTFNDNGDLIFMITMPNGPYKIISDDHLSKLTQFRKLGEFLTSEISGFRYSEIMEDSFRDNLQDLFMCFFKEFREDIDKEFTEKCRAMKAEINNWVYDKQSVAIQSWLSEYEPQRTKYYFDNDPEKNRGEESQEPEFDIDVEDSDDEDYN